MNDNRPRRPIYLDHHASTPVDPRVLEAMLPWFTSRFGNPSSQHLYGIEAQEAIGAARAEVAAAIGAEAREIVFTSGATESNNLAIKGAAHFRKADRPHVVTVVTEHKCVLESVAALAEEGVEVTILPVRRDGLVDLEDLAAAVGDKTALVSVMTAHNETGVLQPMAEIGAIAHARGAWFHTDAAQAFGKIPIDVADAGIDLLSVSGHKIYGPKGVGALFVRRRPRVRLEALFSGGGQERGLRSGTLPTPLCVGIGVAAAVARESMIADAARIGELRDRLHRALDRAIPGLIVNGAGAPRLPGTLNVSIPGVDGQALQQSITEIAVSSGSACTAASIEPSYVLRAMGVGDALAGASLRFGIGRGTTETEIDYAAEHVAAVAGQLGARKAPFDRRPAGA
jgi:cysteine desulfurase